MIVRRLSALMALMALVLLTVACSDSRGPKFSQLNGREFSVTSIEGYPWPAQLATDGRLRLVFVDGQLSMKGECDTVMSKVLLHNGTLITDPAHAAHIGVGCDGHMLDVQDWQAHFYAAPMQLELDDRSLTVTATVDGKRVVISLEEVAFVGIS